MEWLPFKESDKELPEIVVEKMIEGFSTATKELAHLAVSTVSDINRLSTKLNTRFQFDLNLYSNKLPDYSFRIFRFGYNVNIYPVTIMVSSAILKDLNNGGNDFGTIEVIDEESDFKKVVELIFKSNKFIETVGGVMKIASKQNSIF